MGGGSNSFRIGAQNSRAFSAGLPCKKLAPEGARLTMCPGRGEEAGKMAEKCGYPIDRARSRWWGDRYKCRRRGTKVVSAAGAKFGPLCEEHAKEFAAALGEQQPMPVISYFTA